MVANALLHDLHLSKKKPVQFACHEADAEISVRWMIKSYVADWVKRVPESCT